MKLLIDEQTPVQYRDVLAFLLPGHEVAHVVRGRFVRREAMLFEWR